MELEAEMKCTDLAHVHASSPAVMFCFKDIGFGHCSDTPHPVLEIFVRVM